MASYIDKVKINSAITDSTKMDLSCDHITTSSFFAFSPVYVREMCPGEHIKINSEVFSRLQPLTYPTFGRCNINVRGFFVPYRTVWRYWNEFIVNTQATLGQTAWNATSATASTLMGRVPYFSEQQLMDAIMMQCDYHAIDSTFPTYAGRFPWGLVSTSTTGDDDFVFKYNMSGTAVLYYIQLNFFGRMALKILSSLGYGVSCQTNNVPASAPVTGLGSRISSALPLFSLCKIFLDWYINSQYYTTNSYARLVESFTNTQAATIQSLNFQAIAKLIDGMLMSMYDSDYFVSGWEEPTGPVSGMFSDFTFVDVTNDAYTARQLVTTDAASAISPSNTQYKPTNGTPFIGADNAPTYTAAPAGVTTEYVLHALHALTDWMKRNQLAGARVFNRYLARYHVALNDAKLRRSIYLGTHQTGVQFGDIMSTSDQNGQLGAYAGKGIAYSNGDFEYESDEYGMLILTSTIVPSVGYTQGILRHTMHITPTDFFQGEFDNLGVQSLSAAELYLSNNGSYNLSSLDTMWNKTFAYAPRYAEYKVARDRLTGDFAVPSINKGLDAWHMMRMFADTDFNNAASNVSHSYDFTTGQFDGDQFNRIFKGWDTKSLFTMQDMFWLIYHFKVTDYFPAKSLYDTYEFEDKGRTVTMDVNGVELN